MNLRPERPIDFITGFSVAAGLFYYLDPISGGRRRAFMRDKLVRAGHTAAKTANVTARDMMHRAQGTVAESRQLFNNKPVSNEVLVERVRSKLGRYVSHPHAIYVTANDGTVTLTGVIFDSELDKLVSAIAKVNGVTNVTNQLKAFKESEKHSSLQGGHKRPGETIDLFQNRRAPATNFLLTLFGLIGLGAAYALASKNQSMGKLVPIDRVISAIREQLKAA